MKLCKDCKWFRIGNDAMCVAPQIVGPIEIDLVSGREIQKRGETCKALRYPYHTRKSPACGQDGTWFEPKDETK